MTRSSATARRLGTTAVLVVVTALGATTAAEAAPTGGTALARRPTDCTVQSYSTGARAYCSSGTGQYRATVECDRNNRLDYTRRGAWVSAGRWSFATCNSGDRPYNSGIETK